MSRYTVRGIAFAMGSRRGLIETPTAPADSVYDVAPVTDPLGFDNRCVPNREGNSESRTSIVTMNKSLREAKALELTVQSILNRLQFEPLIKEVLAHLSATGSDDTYQQIYAGSHDYLAAQLQQPVDAGLKSFSRLFTAMLVDQSMHSAELSSEQQTAGATA